MILHAIISSVDSSVIIMLGNVKTSKEAWDILHKLFASKTRPRIMHLKECLSRFTEASKPIFEYLNGIKLILNELTLVSSPLDDVDIVIHTSNGLGAEYREVSVPLLGKIQPALRNSMISLLTLRIT